VRDVRNAVSGVAAALLYTRGTCAGAVVLCQRAGEGQLLCVAALMGCVLNLDGDGERDGRAELTLLCAAAADAVMRSIRACR
jgi:hypothetical protein